MCGYVNQNIRAGLALRDANLRAARNPVIVRTLKKDGTPSKLADATKRFASRDEALAKIAYWREVNPGRVLRYSVDGVEA